MLAVSGLRKSYGQTAALKNVCFSAESGEVLGILGENGAGKSTLMRILAGAVQRDAGRIVLGSSELNAASPREALQAGLVLVPQELAYLPDRTVAENIMLGKLPRRHGLVRRKGVVEAAAIFAEQAGVTVALSAPMRSLQLAEAQLVEIAKALARQARVLLLDEPTAALSHQESVRLFDRVARLAASSVTVLCISHRLDEVLEHSDTVLVLRDGIVALHRPTAGVTKRDLVHSMLGAESATSGPTRATTAAGAPVVQLRQVGHLDSHGLHTVDFVANQGEVVGVFSIRGGGQEAVVQTLAGLMPHKVGELRIDGRVCAPFSSPRSAQAAGITFVPADRKRQGLLLKASLMDNVGMPQLKRMSHFGLVRRAREKAAVKEIANAFRLRFIGNRQQVGELSGGNQQKVLIGSRMAIGRPVLVLHEPTRGVDVGARRQIHERLTRLAEHGATIIIATTDVEEAVDLADRLYVLRDGSVIGVLTGSENTAQAALHFAAGGDE